MAEKTLREFSVPSTANVVVGPNINVGDMNFELNSSLINMVQASPFCGKLNEDANTHLQNFLELCDTVVIRGVTANVTKLCLFPFSLLGKAKQWFYSLINMVQASPFCGKLNEDTNAHLQNFLELCDTVVI
jgi:hypothetical protein